MKVSIRLSVLTVLVLFVLIISLLLMYGVSNKFNDRLLSLIIDDIESVVENCEREVSDSVLRIQKANDLLSVNRGFVETLKKKSDNVLERIGSVNNIIEHIESFKNDIGGELYGYSCYFFVNSSLPVASEFENYTNKLILTDSVRVYSDSGLEKEEWYQELKSSEQQMCIFEHSEIPQYVFLAQVIENSIDYNDEILGVSLVGIDFENILRSYGNIENKEFLEIMIVNENSRVIGTNNEGISDEVVKFASAYKTVPEVDSGSMTSVNIGGEEYFACMYELDFGMTLVAAVPREEGLITMEEISHEIFWIVVLILLVALIIAVILSGIIVMPIKRLANFMEDADETAGSGNTVKESPIREIDSLYKSYNGMMLRIKKLIVMAENLGEQKKETEFKMLQAQINPHYLYNALDSIAWTALRKGDEDIADMASALADSFRYNAKSSDMMIDVGSEIRFIENYVALQEKCHKCEFTFEVDIAEEIKKLKIQKFMLQPLVENSIVHGLGRGNDKLRINLTAVITDDLLEISVEDDGIGFDAEKLNNYLGGDDTVFDTEKIGIINVHKRLKNKYGEKAGLRYVSNEHGGLTAIISLPAAEM